MFLLYTLELFYILENKLVGYVDDSTLIAIIPSPSVRDAVAESINRDLGKVIEWCFLLGKNLTKTIIVSRSRTMHPQSYWLILGETVLNKSDELDILVVIFDSKMTFASSVCFQSSLSKDLVP